MAGSYCDWIGTTDGDYETATNWSGIVPITTDYVRIVQTATQAIDTNLDQSAVDLRDFVVEKDCPVVIGKWSAASQIEYLKISLLETTHWDATLRGSGESFLFFDEYRNIFIEEAPSAGDSNYGLNLTGTIDAGAGKVFITAESGTVGIATYTDETFEANEINTTDANVTLGSGVYAADGAAAMPLLNIKGGTVINRAAVTTINVDNCDFRHESGAVTTMTIKSGTAIIAGAETIGTIYARANTTLDMTGDLQAKTITHLYVGAGVTLDFRGGHVTVTNDIHLQGCSLSDITILIDPEEAISFD